MTEKERAIYEETLHVRSIECNKQVTESLYENLIKFFEDLFSQNVEIKSTINTEILFHSYMLTNLTASLLKLYILKMDNHAEKTKFLNYMEATFKMMFEKTRDSCVFPQQSTSIN